MTPLNESTINAAMAKLRERIAELESTIAAQHDLLEERGEALERAQGRVAELEAQLAATLAVIETTLISVPFSSMFGDNGRYSVEGYKP